MATLAEKRAWLREYTSEDIPARGRLRPDLEAVYDTAHPADTVADLPDDLDWDLDGDPGVADPDDLEPSVPMQAERPPRSPRSQRAERRAQPATQRASGLIGKLIAGDKKAKPGPKKKAPPRMSLEKFTTRMYSSIGRMAAVISVPMSNCIQAQAAMAGVIMEDVAQGTIVDRLLQPAARAEDKLDKVFALVAPPLIVLGLEQSAQLPQQQAMVRQAFLMPILRESLRIGLEVSDSYADQMRARLEQDAKWDAQIDDLIRMIFMQPTATVEDVPEPEMQPA